MNVWVSPSWDSVLITSECSLGFWSSQSTPVMLRYSWCGKHYSGSHHGSCGIFIGKPFNLEFFLSFSNFPCSVQSFSHVLLFVTPWTAACQASLSITNSQAYSNSCPSSRWCHPTISPSVVPFSSHLQSFPASGSFPRSQFFTSGGQNIGVSASASVLPTNIQDWFPLGWTGLISLQSKGLSRVFSNTTVQKHQFFGTKLSL